MKCFTLIAILLLPIFLFSQNSASTVDARSSSVADSVMMAMGGKQNWEQVHYLKWNFFGRRIIWWDKWTSNVRIEIPAKSLLILTNINTRQGHVYRFGKELTQDDSINYFMDRGFKIWANDSYWLIMPFKLKDPGVNVSYKGEVNDPQGNNCFLLELTFNKVGVTPENKYHIYVNKKDYLVSYWDYFEKFSDTKPEVSNPWTGYKQYGNILLSGDRGPDEGMISDIEVMNSVRGELFEKP